MGPPDRAPSGLTAAGAVKEAVLEVRPGRCSWLRDVEGLLVPARDPDAALRLLVGSRGLLPEPGDRVGQAPPGEVVAPGDRGPAVSMLTVRAGASPGRITEALRRHADDLERLGGGWGAMALALAQVAPPPLLPLLPAPAPATLPEAVAGRSAPSPVGVPCEDREEMPTVECAGGVMNMEWRRAGAGRAPAWLWDEAREPGLCMASSASSTCCASTSSSSGMGGAKRTLLLRLAALDSVGGGPRQLLLLALLGPLALTAPALPPAAPVGPCRVLTYSEKGTEAGCCCSAAPPAGAPAPRPTRPAGRLPAVKDMALLTMGCPSLATALVDTVPLAAARHVSAAVLGRLPSVGR